MSAPDHPKTAAPRTLRAKAGRVASSSLVAFAVARLRREMVMMGHSEESIDAYVIDKAPQLSKMDEADLSAAILREVSTDNVYPL